MQRQGTKISDAGRLDGSLGSPVVAADFALGAGWGDGAPTVEVVAGSTDQRGTIIVTSDGANQAQATATVELTFADGEYAAAPVALVQLVANDTAVDTPQPTDVTPAVGSLAWTHAALPVAGDTYTFTYAVIA